MTTLLDKYDNDILELPLVVGISQSVEELNKYYSYTNGDPIDDDLITFSGSCCVLNDKETDKLVIYVGINSMPSYVKKRNKQEQQCWIMNTIAHECFHAFMDSMKIIRDTPDVDHQEMNAYYMGWLVECVYKSWVKSTKTKKSDAK